MEKKVLSQICTLFDIFRDTVVSAEQLKIFHQLSFSSMVFFVKSQRAPTINKVIDMSTVVSVACLRQFTLFTNTQLVGWCK